MTLHTFALTCILAKAPLRVLYDKIQHEGRVKWQIQHEAKPSAVFATRPHPSAVFYCTTQVYGAFTDFLVLRGRTDYFDWILDRCFRLSVLAALTEWIHKAMQINKPTQ